MNARRRGGVFCPCSSGVLSSDYLTPPLFTGGPV